MKNVLNFNTDVKYNTWARGELSVRPWDRETLTLGVTLEKL
ncbi:MAG: hypothetical protein CM15mP102_03000 [Flavobacteriales bacterium]|nr:MAG: hypothetical protein CM15mP102_03000 [Flavobacteriales bacterium]